MAKLTAVEWFVEQLRSLAHDANTHLGMGDVRVTQGYIDELEEQAKQMEKEQVELKYKDGTPMRKYNSPKLQELEQINQDNPVTRGSTALVYKQETLEEAAEKYSLELLEAKTIDPHEKTWIKSMFIHIVKWQQERMLKFILDEDNHTEGELGNSCIDVQTLVHFIEQFKKK